MGDLESCKEEFQLECVGSEASQAFCAGAAVNSAVTPTEEGAPEAVVGRVVRAWTMGPVCWE